MTANRFSFRAWDKSTSTMIGGPTGTLPEWDHYVHVDGTGIYEYHEEVGSYHQDHCMHQEPGFMIMQSTGLLDKNGVEIFEGDVVRQTLIFDHNVEYHEGECADKTFIGPVVVIASKGACIKYPQWIDNLDDTTGRNDGYMNVRAYRAEVIGNIYENPELMKGNAK